MYQTHRKLTETRYIIDAIKTQRKATDAVNNQPNATDTNIRTNSTNIQQNICYYSDWVCTAVMSNDVMKDLRG